MYLGFKDEYTASCEECGSSRGSGLDLYNYNYAWNSEVGMRSFWEDTDKGYHQVQKWWKSCPSGYERESWFSWWKR